jgi:hypothetical protein
LATSAAIAARCRSLPAPSTLANSMYPSSLFLASTHASSHLSVRLRLLSAREEEA